MLIRHAEKPESASGDRGDRGGFGNSGDRGDSGGVDEARAPAPGSLSVQGWRRAAALVAYFGSATEGGDGPIRRPRHIVAARPTERHPSTRPGDSVYAVADFLGLKVNEGWSDEDDARVVADALRSLEGAVLVCWRHDALPRLARELIADDRIPAAWPADRFDVTWSILRAGQSWRFQQVPQLLLPGDSEQTITME